MFDLAGKRALVTGASGGIGNAVARALHAQGAVVTLSGTRSGPLDDLAGELGGRVHAVPCDLSCPASPGELVKEAGARMGGLDILVANAGITRDSLIMTMKEDMWNAVIDVNLTAYFRLCKAAVRGMLRQRSGRIIGVTSVIGAGGNAGQANYAASKAGMTGMSKSLAQEVAGRNVTVNCVAPGFIGTPMTDALDERQREAALARIPAGAMGTPADVAGAIVFLASGEAGYITGQTLHVNGGMAMI